MPIFVGLALLIFCYEHSKLKYKTAPLPGLTDPVLHKEGGVR